MHNFKDNRFWKDNEVMSEITENLSRCIKLLPLDILEALAKPEFDEDEEASIREVTEGNISYVSESGYAPHTPQYVSSTAVTKSVSPYDVQHVILPLPDEESVCYKARQQWRKSKTLEIFNRIFRRLSLDKTTLNQRTSCLVTDSCAPVETEYYSNWSKSCSVEPSASQGSEISYFQVRPPKSYQRSYQLSKKHTAFAFLTSIVIFIFIVILSVVLISVFKSNS